MHKLLELTALVDLKIDGGKIYEVSTKRYYKFMLFDFLLLIGCMSLTLTTNTFTSTRFSTAIFSLYFSTYIIKYVISSLRRIKQKKCIPVIWKGLIDLENDFKNIGINLNYKYIKYTGFSICLTIVTIRLLNMLAVFVLNENFNILDKINFSMLILLDISPNILKAEYITYLTIFDQYFKQLSLCYTRGRFQTKKIRKMYVNLCDTSKQTFQALWICIMFTLQESALIITLHTHNIISKYYDSKNTKFWFFDLKYSVPWFIEYLFGFICVVVPSCMCFYSVSYILISLFMYFNIVLISGKQNQKCFEELSHFRERSPGPEKYATICFTINARRFRSRLPRFVFH